MRLHLLLALLTPLIALSGCAYVTAVPAPPGSEVEGIRVPGFKPLLVVTGGQVQLLTVPNPNREYALRFGSFLAEHKFEAEFSNGFINKVSSDQDSTAVAIQLLTSLTEAAKAGVGLFDGFSDRAGSGAATDLQIYDIVFDEEGNLVELRPLITKAGIDPFARVAIEQMQREGPDAPEGTIDIN